MPRPRLVLCRACDGRFPWSRGIVADSFNCKGCLDRKRLEHEVEALREKVRVLEGPVITDPLVVEPPVDEEAISTNNDILEGEWVVVDEVEGDSDRGLIIGDSMVRELGNRVCRDFRGFERCCLPGGKIGNVRDVFHRRKLPLRVILWVGTNQVGANISESLSEYRDLLLSAREGGSDVAVIPVLPRGSRGYRSRIHQFNIGLKDICSSLGVTFLELPAFTDRWLRSDGIHLNKRGVWEVYDSLRSGFLLPDHVVGNAG